MSKKRSDPSFINTHYFGSTMQFCMQSKVRERFQAFSEFTILLNQPLREYTLKFVNPEIHDLYNLSPKNAQAKTKPHGEAENRTDSANELNFSFTSQPITQIYNSAKQSIFRVGPTAGNMSVLTMHSRDGKGRGLPIHSKQIPPETQ